MSLVRWDPLQMVRWPSMWDDDDFVPSTTNNMDVYETENEVVVKASVPGIAEDKVEITFEPMWTPSMELRAALGI